MQCGEGAETEDVVLDPRKRRGCELWLCHCLAIGPVSRPRYVSLLTGRPHDLSHRVDSRHIAHGSSAIRHRLVRRTRLLLCPTDRSRSNICALLLQISILIVPVFWANAIAFSLTGFVLGPIYPSLIMVATDFLPGELHLGVISLMGSMGGAGAALWPLCVTPYSLQAWARTKLTRQYRRGLVRWGR
jgi:MFS family permease